MTQREVLVHIPVDIWGNVIPTYPLGIVDEIVYKIQNIVVAILISIKRILINHIFILEINVSTTQSISTLCIISYF